MNNSGESPKQTAVAGWGAVGVGLILLVIGLFFDPIGSDPDTGMIHLGVTGTKWLLDAFGALFLLTGAWALIKARPGRSKS
jgi:hypothetical protein